MEADRIAILTPHMRLAMPVSSSRSTPAAALVKYKMLGGRRLRRSTSPQSQPSQQLGVHRDDDRRHAHGDRSHAHGEV